MPYPAKGHLRIPTGLCLAKENLWFEHQPQACVPADERTGIRARIRPRKPYFGRREAGITSTNVLNRDFNATAPNTKWVTDVTYLPIGSRFLYLSVIFDLYNNEVVAFRIGRHNNLKLVLETVQAAVHQRKVTNLLLHSDQGFQYTHKEYPALLKRKKMKVSMSRKGKTAGITLVSRASLDTSSQNVFDSTPSRPKRSSLIRLNDISIFTTTNDFNKN